MYTTTKCPRCGNDFMYHPTDIHLKRAMTVDGDGKEPCSYETICQNCDEIERQPNIIKKKKMQTMREEALEWFRSLSLLEAYDIIYAWKEKTNDYRKHWHNQLICTSSSTIEKIWREFINKENFND